MYKWSQNSHRLDNCALGIVGEDHFFHCWSFCLSLDWIFEWLSMYRWRKKICKGAQWKGNKKCQVASAIWNFWLAVLEYHAKRSGVSFGGVCVYRLEEVWGLTSTVSMYRMNCSCDANIFLGLEDKKLIWVDSQLLCLCFSDHVLWRGTGKHLDLLVCSH